ncbi:hypothetical protein LRAMOSA08999 [Lichtheimia ramosa]|uniref:Uncharacterized protein n=1 Tax=Lichtheimia ramosa TaxID=688394 RepID=A0A077WFU7_9FUNG|nr:hypothetical protein LRAMOSA08999 [Lichtheimia ramosa]
MRISLLVAVAFVLGATAQAPPPPGEPAADPNTATEPAKTQTAEEYLKLYPSEDLKAVCQQGCSQYQDAEGKDKCCKKLIMDTAPLFGLPEPNFQ